jgi:cytochrome b
MKDMESTGNGAQGVPVLVWDLPVRLFHWLIVVLVLSAWVTKEVGGNAMTYHMWIGYTVLALVLFRVLWGFVGSACARFSDFVCAPGTVLRYLFGASQEGAIRSHGHNPAGGWSVLALLTCLLVQAVTGLFANDEIFIEGPLAGRVGQDMSNWITTVHRYNFNVLLGLIALHVAAVLFHLLVKRENLIVPMITGRKRVPPEHATSARPVGVWRAVLALLVCAGVVAAVLNLG